MSTPTRRVMMDATELLQNPVQSGIQRVVRSMIQHWPDRSQLALCRFDQAQQCLVAVRDDVADILTAPSLGASHRELTARIAAGMGPAIPLDMGGKMLVPEIFFDFPRCAHHRWRLHAKQQDTFFFAHDFIPWLYPAAMATPETSPLMHYLQIVRDAAHVGFNSAHTRDEYITRITRNRHGGDLRVFPLGADGPNIPRQSWNPTRDTFLTVGSVDGRKNQALVLDAFELLWAQGSTARLTLVGRLFENSAVEGLARRIESFRHRYPGFTHLSDISDTDFAALYGTARATIYASELEGFGLPPVESLHCGVPVIASAKVPSVGELPEAGQVRLAGVTAQSIADAVQRLSDDHEAARLWSEAEVVHTSRWVDMVADIAAWVGPP